MPVKILTLADPDVTAAVNDLIPQLSSSPVELNAAEVQDILDQPGVYVFGFTDEASGEILGMLTLVTFRIPTGLRAWIEDVVVDTKARGQGAGQALVEAALNQAQSLGCRTVDLTSRASREAANRLYQRMGFETRETNLYRYAAS